MKDPVIVELPKLYENMDEATVGPWQVAVGDTVSEGDFIVELITDKMVAEFEVPCGGTVLALYATEKSTIPIGYALCAIGEAGADAPDMSASNEAKLAEHANAAALDIDMSILSEPKEAPVEKPKFRAAPAARNVARKYGVDLADVAVFCGKDIVHKKDVEEFLAQQASAPADETGAGAAAAPSPGVDLNGKIALVTGASGAIGGAIAKALASAGATVAVHYNANQSAAQKVLDTIEAAGGKGMLCTGDLTDPETCNALVATITDTHERLDILVNNAGALADSVVSFMTDAQWRKALDVNLTAPFNLTRAAAMTMARQRWGRVINISSDAGRLGSANRANYAAAKAGLAGFTRSVAREMAGMGVRINAVSPGFVESPMTEGLNEAKRKEITKTIPVRRFGRPEDVAELVAFLASDRADYITGQEISVDGGLFMG